MVEIEGSTTWIYMSIRLLNVFRNDGACRDTTGGCRTFVVLHAVIGVNDQHFNTSGNHFLSSAGPGHVYRCVPVIRETRCQKTRSESHSLICSRNSKILFHGILTVENQIPVPRRVRESGYISLPGSPKMVSSPS